MGWAGEKSDLGNLRPFTLLLIRMGQGGKKCIFLKDPERLYVFIGEEV